MFEGFSSIFSNVFTGMINNRELIDNIVDSILNNESFNNLVQNLENMVSLDVDIKEYKSAYIIEGTVPGIDKKDITIDYDNNYITVEIKRNNQVFSNGKNTVFAVVQSSGTDMAKDFFVEDVDPYKIKAVLRNGLLRIYAPKKVYNGEVIEVMEVMEVVDVENYYEE